MLDRFLFILIGLALGMAAWYFDFGYLGLGILIGLAVPCLSVIRGASFTSSFNTGALIALTGIVCYLAAVFYCNKYGMSLAECYAASVFTKHIRRLPFYGISCLTAGIIIMIFDILGRRDGK